MLLISASFINILVNLKFLFSYFYTFIFCKLVCIKWNFFFDLLINKETKGYFYFAL